jgi:WD40 repeat protein
VFLCSTVLYWLSADLGVFVRQITGSLDATVIVWDIVWPAGSSSPELSGTPRATLYGHRDEITCTAVHTGLGIVASTSKTGCIVHKTQGGFIRALSASPDTDSFDKVLISSQGTILLYSSSDLMLFLFSVNGQLLASADAMERLHAWALTSDNKCVVTGSDRMIVKVRALHNLKTLHTFGQLEAPIYSLTLCAEENVVMVSHSSFTGWAAGAWRCVGVPVLRCLTGACMHRAGRTGGWSHCYAHDAMRYS